MRGSSKRIVPGSMAGTHSSVGAAGLPGPCSSQGHGAVCRLPS